MLYFYLDIDLLNMCKTWNTYQFLKYLPKQVQDIVQSTLQKVQNMLLQVLGQEKLDHMFN